MHNPHAIKATAKLSWLWFAWVPLLFAFDQITKWLVLKNVALGEFLPLLPGIHLTLSYNDGIAFSLLTHQATLMQNLLVLFIGVICMSVAVLLAKTPYDDKWCGIGYTLILGGALGNLADRLWHGYVIDFIDCYISSWHWYTFNMADSFITCGALMLIKTLLLGPAHK